MTAGISLNGAEIVKKIPLKINSSAKSVPFVKIHFLDWQLYSLLLMGFRHNGDTPKDPRSPHLRMVKQLYAMTATGKLMFIGGLSHYLVALT